MNTVPQIQEDVQSDNLQVQNDDPQAFLPRNASDSPINVNIHQYIGQQLNIQDNKQTHNIIESNTFDLAHGKDINIGSSSDGCNQKLENENTSAQTQPRASCSQQSQQLTQSTRVATRSLSQQLSSSCEAASQRGSNQAIEKLKRYQDHYCCEHDVDLTKPDLDSSKIPTIYPEVHSIYFYEGRYAPNDGKYTSRYRKNNLIPTDKTITIDELLLECKREKFSSIIGYPGAGKSTLAKRIARKLAKRGEACVAFRFQFLEMSDSEDEMLTLKQFLVGDVNYNLTEEEKESAFTWIRSNPKNCFIIIDGFDQVRWNIKEKLKAATYDTPLNHQDLISNLCQGKFLRNSHIIITSRPHPLLEIPKRCRPKRIYMLCGFSSDDMKSLFYFLIDNKQKADTIWKELKLKTPQLQMMCNNPLMLQLYVRASLQSCNNIGYITTMTRVFHAVLQNLKATDHAVTLNDAIVISLARLAYESTKMRTVLITIKALESEKLTVCQVQDLVVTFLKSNQKCGLLEGTKSLYFIHQTFQEYFAALYISYEMPLNEFTSFVQNEMLTDYWSVVVQFVSGLLLDPDLRNGNNKKKREVFLSALQKRTTKAATSEYEDMAIGWRILSLCKILRESYNDDVIATMANCFSRGCIKVSDNILTHCDVHALACVIKEIPTHIQRLDLSGCNITSEKFFLLAEAIKAMPGSIGNLNMKYNLLANVEEILPILNKVEDFLYLQRCFRDDEVGERNATLNEQQLLKEALDRTENTKLTIEIDRKIFNEEKRTVKHKNKID